MFFYIQLCRLPDGCVFHRFDLFEAWWNEEIVSSRADNGIKCIVDDGGHFWASATNNKSISNNFNFTRECNSPWSVECLIEVKPPSWHRKILDKHFNMHNFMEFLDYLDCYFKTRFTNINGFELDMFPSNTIRGQTNLQALLEVEISLWFGKWFGFSSIEA